MFFYFVMGLISKVISMSISLLIRSIDLMRSNKNNIDINIDIDIIVDIISDADINVDIKYYVGSFVIFKF